ncbi:ammonium transporter [Magnetofaba australis]|uniref:Putative diguanylate cyclase/phosphodiesterase n=1 Tax=Magnetofaba australis IT-1 TaxID=1434232 RepID=A0A1Y2K2K9_9PROT|nr:ammonium transporter [Magnetofaba australis]OSM02268.1 putative diguanylate cyclase/phosphodiesterase [Magnetofaba australis IT-1]
MDQKSLLDILWITLSASLVLLMQAGFLCLETGLTRSKNSINVAMKNAMDFSVSLVAFLAVGYGLMFGPSASGWLSSVHFFWLGDESPRTLIFFLFQAMFCSTAVTIVSGAVAERLDFKAYVLISAIIAMTIYPVFGHWAWGGLDGEALTGWLGKLGFVDWAGSTVVHSVGGWFSLALLLVVGARIDRFNEDGSINPVTGSNLPLTALGALILWFGWIGFNGGSTLALDERIPGIVVNTCLGAAGGGVAGLAWARMFDGSASFVGVVNGALAGLVSVTAGAHAFDASSALLVGAIGGPISWLLEHALLRLRIDDAVGAVPVHLGGGVWGTLAVALWGNAEALGTGLSRLEQMKAQLTGVGAAFAIAFVGPLILLWLLNKIMPLRVPPEHERMGLNISEHGARTELGDFIGHLQNQEQSGDTALRAPVDPFSEVGLIAHRYNRVMDALEEAIYKTRAIVRTASDAILTFDPATWRVTSHNPMAESMFGYDADAMREVTLNDIARFENAHMSGMGECVEGVGVRSDGQRFPMEITMTRSEGGDTGILIGAFRDISARKVAEEALKESETRFRSLFENAALGMALIGEDRRLEDVNGAMTRMFERDAEELAVLTLADLAHPDDVELVGALLEQVLAGDSGEVTCEARFVCASGLMIWTRVAFSPAHFMDADKMRAVAMFEDITTQRRAQESVRLAAAVFEGANESVVIFNHLGAVEQVNQAFCRITGYAPRETRGLELKHLLSASYDRDFFEGVNKQLRERDHWQGEVKGRRKNGDLAPEWLSLSVVRQPDGAIQNIIAVLTDWTERKEQEEAVWRHANFDQLTELPNRRLFQDRLTQALQQSQRNHGKVGLFFLDLDRFKPINDTLGHQAGDELLQLTARRLERCVRHSDTVSRLGGDEFTIIVQNVHDSTLLARIADNAISALDRTFELEAGQANISTSIGIAVYPDDARNADELLRAADAALYQAKESGRNNKQFFTESLNSRIRERAELERGLRLALENHELFLQYQPQVDIASGALVGAEALVRWRRADGSVVPPDRFIPLAEETGLILPLGEEVARMASAQIRAWSDAGFTAPPISINASARQFNLEGGGLAEMLRVVCGEVGIEPKRLVVEITENSLMADPANSGNLLQSLRNLGVDIELDDFGTGYSSLARLNRLQIQALKLDRSFLAGLPENSQNRAMVTAVVNMALGMGLGVVAEGVETDAQMDFLADLKCHRAQGYGVARPLDPEAFVAFAEARVGRLQIA